MLRQLRDIVPDDDAVVAAAEAAATNRQCKAEADTADSRRRKAEAAEKFRQVYKSVECQRQMETSQATTL
jgi:hypothetical protein